MKATGPTLAISKEIRIGKVLGLLKVVVISLSLTRIIIDLWSKFD